MDLAEEIEVEGGHPVVVGDTGEEVHENQLTVALATIARFLLRRRLRLCPALHDDDGRSPPTSDGLTARQHHLEPKTEVYSL